MSVAGTDALAMSRSRAHLPLVLGVSLGLALLIANAAYYFPFIADDSLISLRYSERFLLGKGLTWDDYARVEGYSNLLWVLGCAALGALRIDLVTGARILGVTCSALAVVALARRGRRDALAAAAAAGGFGAAAPVGAWAVGGLEQPLVAALLAWGIVLLFDVIETEGELAWSAVAKPAVVLGLLAWTRPDGALFPLAAAPLAFVSRRWLERRPQSARLLAIVVPALVLVALQLTFRIAYYGDYVPNTAHAKLGTSSWRRVEGFWYVEDGIKTLLPLVSVAVLAVPLAIAKRASRGRVLIAFCLLTLWYAYLIVIGGDILPAHRHHVPAAVLLALLAGEAVSAIVTSFSRTRPRLRLALASAIGLMLACTVWTSRDNVNLRNAKTERWEHVCGKIATGIGRAYALEQPLLAVDPAGCAPFYSKLPSIDMLGLNDRYIARHSRTDATHSVIGHGLGDGAYVFSRAPDLVLFCGVEGGQRACFASGQELDGARAFHEDYRLATFDVDGSRARFFVRWRSPKIGYREVTPGTFELPGVLFGVGAHASAQVRADGVGPIIEPGHAAHVERVPLPAGRYRVTADATAPVDVTVYQWGKAATVATPSEALTLESAADVDVEVTTAAAQAFVRKVAFTASP